MLCGQYLPESSRVMTPTPTSALVPTADAFTSREWDTIRGGLSHSSVERISGIFLLMWSFQTFYYPKKVLLCFIKCGVTRKGMFEKVKTQTNTWIHLLEFQLFFEKWKLQFISWWKNRKEDSFKKPCYLDEG